MTTSAPQAQGAALPDELLVGNLVAATLAEERAHNEEHGEHETSAAEDRFIKARGAVLRALGYAAKCDQQRDRLLETLQLVANDLPTLRGSLSGNQENTLWGLESLIEAALVRKSDAQACIAETAAERDRLTTRCADLEAANRVRQHTADTLSAERDRLRRERDVLLIALSNLIHRYRVDGIPNDSLPFVEAAQDVIDSLEAGTVPDTDEERLRTVSAELLRALESLSGVVSVSRPGDPVSQALYAAATAIASARAAGVQA